MTEDFHGHAGAKEDKVSGRYEDIILKLYDQLLLPKN